MSEQDVKELRDMVATIQAMVEDMVDWVGGLDSTTPEQLHNEKRELQMEPYES